MGKSPESPLLQQVSSPIRKVSWSWLKLIGLILFGILIFSLDWKEAINIVLKTDPAFIALAGALNFLFIIFKSLRWYTLLKLQNINYGLVRALRIYQAGSFFSIVTPGRLGDLIKVAYLKRDTGVLNRIGLVSVIFDRLFDLITLALSALLFLLLEKTPASMGTSIIIFACLLAVLTPLTFSRIFFRFTISAFSKLPLIGKKLHNKSAELQEWHSMLRQVVRLSLIGPFALSCLAYGSLFAGGYVLALGQNFPLSFIQAGFCIALANVVALLPFSVAGVGTRDVAMVVMFATFGLSQAQALLFSIGYLFVNLIFANTLGAFFWLQETRRGDVFSSSTATLVGIGTTR